MAKTASKTQKTKSKPDYKIVVSVKSPSLAYTSKRLGELVAEEMESGWMPHGSPLLAIEEDEYIISQAVIKV